MNSTGITVRLPTAAVQQGDPGDKRYWPFAEFIGTS